MQERRALSGKGEQLLNQIAKLKVERDSAATQLEQSECDVQQLEEQLERATTLLQV